MEQEIINLLNDICPADRVGTGHDTETPYILFDYSESEYKYEFAYRGNLTLYIIDYKKNDVETKYHQVQNALGNKYLGSYLIRNVEYTKPITTPLPDGRYMQEISVLITFEEV